MTAGADSGPLRLLVTALAQRHLAPLIAAQQGPRAVQLLALEEIADDESRGVHAAFISRDLTGLSTKFVVLDELAACHRVLRRSSELAWVHTHSAGNDRPIYAELQARGVAVSTSSGANAEVVAHSALAGLLALARRLPQLMAAQQRRAWEPLLSGPLPPDLRGQTVLLLGWGPIARCLQPLLSMLGLHVVVLRRGAEAAGADIETWPHTQLHAVLPRAQWLLLACPLTPQTRGLIDAAAQALLPPGAMVVNVARGEVIDEAALIAALQSGHLGGAFLDVFEHEPLPTDSPLWTLPGVIVSPHAAGHGAGNAARTQAMFLDNLGRWLRGEALINAVK